MANNLNDALGVGGEKLQHNQPAVLPACVTLALEEFLGCSRWCRCPFRRF